MSLGGRRGRVNVVPVRYGGRPVENIYFSSFSECDLSTHSEAQSLHTVYSVDGSINDMTRCCFSSHGLLIAVIFCLGHRMPLAKVFFQGSVPAYTFGGARFI